MPISACERTAADIEKNVELYADAARQDQLEIDATARRQALANQLQKHNQTVHLLETRILEESNSACQKLEEAGVRYLLSLELIK